MLAQADCPRWLRIARSPWGFLLLAAVPATLAIVEILRATGGTPAVPLDDSYIHFQFAHSFASGRPFVYSPGTAPVPGATSLLWPLLLAVPESFGVHGSAIIPWAWGLAFVALGLLAFETAAAARQITSERMAWLAGLLVLTFSANTWFAASGMEVVPLAWLLMRCTRRAAEWLEAGDEHGRVRELLLLAVAAPLMRPEGALGSALIAVALLLGTRSKRPLSLLALGAALLPPAINVLFTGHATQTTMRVKWLPFNPYLDVDALLETILANVRLFFGTLLDGQQWSLAFLPTGSKLVAWLSLPALIYAGQIRQRSARAMLLVVLGLGILIPTTYDSFLWNRLRYLWPFASPWLIGVVALADQLGELLALWRPRLGLIRYALGAAPIAAFASTFPFALYDLGVSANAISQQQVALANWAKDALPSEARIGVNDTGAIGYFSEHGVFDIVGLTTLGEARYWSAGPGSRFEHYEHLSRAVLPTHFIVYPGWFGIPDLLGPCLTERTVNATILGGTTMLACIADYSRLGSGAEPSLAAFWKQSPRDELDVADLESEASHHYELPPATQLDDVVLSNRVVSDGGRRNRQRESFDFDLAPRGRMVARLGAATPLSVELRVSGRLVDSWTVSSPDFEDHALTLPADLTAGRQRVVVSAHGGTFSAAHYWSYSRAQ